MVKKLRDISDLQKRLSEAEEGFHPCVRKSRNGGPGDVINAVEEQQTQRQSE